jgi:hypothetical protein
VRKEVRDATAPLEQRLAALEAGAHSLKYRGTFSAGTVYEVGNFVTFAGSLWHCQERTIAKPGDGAKEWKLAVKRGRDGKDGR